MLYEEQRTIIGIQRNQIEVLKERVKVADKIAKSYEDLVKLHKKRNMFLVILFVMMQIVSTILWIIYIKNK